MYSGPHQNQGWGWRRETGLSPPVKYFTDRSKAVLLLWIFYVFVRSCVCYVLCASVYMCFVVTCWERADLLALVCGVFCEFVTFPLVSLVRCGTWLYRFLIFATLLTFWAQTFLSQNLMSMSILWAIFFTLSLASRFISSNISIDNNSFGLNWTATTFEVNEAIVKFIVSTEN